MCTLNSRSHKRLVFNISGSLLYTFVFYMARSNVTSFPLTVDDKSIETIVIVGIECIVRSYSLQMTDILLQQGLDMLTESFEPSTKALQHSLNIIVTICKAIRDFFYFFFHMIYFSRFFYSRGVKLMEFNSTRNALRIQRKVGNGRVLIGREPRTLLYAEYSVQFIYNHCSRLNPHPSHLE